jgi:hypothetical protein
MITNNGVIVVRFASLLPHKDIPSIRPNCQRLWDTKENAHDETLIAAMVWRLRGVDSSVLSNTCSHCVT